MRIFTVLAATVVLSCGLLAAKSLPTAASPQQTKKKHADKPAPPQGVSPARPDIPMPKTDHWYCWRCGAGNPYPKKHFKGPMHRPLLAPPGDAPPQSDALERPGRMHVNKRATRGGRRGLPAQRILRHKKQLNLTGEQIAQLETLAFDSQKHLIDLGADVQKERLELRRLLHSDSDDMRRINRRLSAVAKTRMEIQQTRITNWIAAKKILTDEQRSFIEARPGIGGFMGGNN